MGANFDPNYKLKHRLPPISRLATYKYFPPPMVDDPPGGWKSWEERCEAVYSWMMARKRGVQPERARRGLWFYADGAQSSNLTHDSAI